MNVTDLRGARLARLRRIAPTHPVFRVPTQRDTPVTPTLTGYTLVVGDRVATGSREEVPDDPDLRLVWNHHASTR